MSKCEDSVFGRDAQARFATLRALARDFAHAPVRYQFISVEEHRALWERSLTAGNRVQVIELLYLAHFAASATLIRTLRWAEGCLCTFEEGLFLPFCASARGLLEATGDSLDALKFVGLALSANHEALNWALAEKSPPSRLIVDDLENALLHFSHGRRLSKEERSSQPAYAKTKDLTDYVKTLEPHYALGGMVDWYGELCQLTHPAADSVGYMLQRTDGEQWIFDPSVEREHITSHLVRHRERLGALLAIAQNPALVLLKVLLHLDLPTLHVSSAQKLDLRGLPLWRKCAGNLGLAPG